MVPLSVKTNMHNIYIHIYFIYNFIYSLPSACTFAAEQNAERDRRKLKDTQQSYQEEVDELRKALVCREVVRQISQFME